MTLIYRFGEETNKHSILRFTHAVIKMVKNCD